jgi:hypothetical protein
LLLPAACRCCLPLQMLLLPAAVAGFINDR